MATLTKGRLRALRRLVRGNVDGAAESLADLARADLAAAAAVTGRSREELGSLGTNELAALVATAAPPTMRRPFATPDQARCAADLGAWAVARGAHAHALDPTSLIALVRHLKGPAVRFGGYGSVKTPLLRAVTHALRGVELSGVVASDGALSLTYRGKRCRGNLRLRLEHRPAGAHDVVVLLATSEESISCELPASDVIGNRPAPSPPVRPFLAVFVGVALDALVETWRSR